jgi:outer membrane protein assembly factor BamB
MPVTPRSLSVRLLTAGIMLGLAPTAAAQVQNESQKLLATDRQGGDFLGVAVAIDGGTVVVGAGGDADNGSFSGSVYLFDASTGAEVDKLLASDGMANDQFGWAVAIDDGVVAVGALGGVGSGVKSGTAYLFDADTGAELFKLVPFDGAFDDQFGRSIAIGGGLVAVGAYKDDDNFTESGSVYIFDASTGAFVRKIVPADNAIIDRFGFSVALDGGVLAVGAPYDSDNGSFAGSAYLFDPSTGTQLAKLLPTDGVGGQEFGTSVDIDGGRVIVGAWFDADNGSRSGAAYLFDATTGAQLAKLKPADGEEDNRFGYAVSLAGGTAGIGAWFDNDNGLRSGSAYYFDAASGSEVTKLLPSDGAIRDEFGISIGGTVGMDGPVFVVGSQGDDTIALDTGSAYLFDAPASGDCAADTNGDGSVTPGRLQRLDHRVQRSIARVRSERRRAVHAGRLQRVDHQLQRGMLSWRDAELAGC